MKAPPRRSNIPAILAFGVCSIVALGGAVSFLSGKPIVRLKADLEKLYGVRGFRCSLRLQENRMEVEPPRALELDPLARRRLGAVAFERYYKLAQGHTVVELVDVLPSPVETVTQDQVSIWRPAEEISEKIVADARAIAGPETQVTIAPTTGGTAIVFDTACDDEKVRRLDDMAIKLPNVTLVRIRHDGKVIRESGPEAPRPVLPARAPTPPSSGAVPAAPR
jgi:hypothetical protein